MEEYLEPAGISQTEFAKHIGVARRRINDIARGKRAVTADTAMRFAKAFGTTPEFWLSMQASYELAIARKDSKRLKFRTLAPFKIATS